MEEIIGFKIPYSAFHIPHCQSLSFKLKQEFLALDAAAVAGQLAVRPD